jgi:hypothetical protein
LPRCVCADCLEIAIAFDPSACDNANIRNLDKRGTRLWREKDALDGHRCTSINTPTMISMSGHH